MKDYEIWLAATRKKLAAAVAEAEPLVAAGDYDAAERLVRAVNSDIYGAVALGEMFTRALSRCERRGYRAEALYGRALRWRSAWPGIHTAEEAAAERAHEEEVSQELKALIESLPE
ncbi:MAG: hypothetical protein NTW74_11900 [Acidobacteria bacterium]|nr:hypothetical protein [Acidobacteriota bacterium]